METRHEEKPWGSCGKGAPLPQSRQPPSFLRTRPEGQHRQCCPPGKRAAPTGSAYAGRGSGHGGGGGVCVGGSPQRAPRQRPLSGGWGRREREKKGREGRRARPRPAAGAEGAPPRPRARPPLPFSPAPSPPRRLLPSELPASMLPQ